MPFTSTILQSSTTAKVYSINEDKPTVDSYLDTILQLNESMHRIETDYNRNYYRYLVEDAMGYSTDIAIQEGLLGDIKEKIIKAIDAIIEFIKNFFRKIDGRSADAEYSKFDNERKNKSESSDNTNQRTSASGSNNNSSNHYDLNKEYEFKVYRFPDPSDVAGAKFRSLIRELVSMIDSLCKKGEDDRSKEVEQTDTTYNSTIYGPLKRFIRGSRKTFSGTVKDPESFRQYILADVIYTETVKMRPQQFINIINSVPRYTDRDFEEIYRGVTEDLNNAKNLVKRSQIDDEECMRNINYLVAHINRFVQSITWFTGCLKNAYLQALKYYDSKLNEIRGRSYSESAFIHGEPFDSDTLFDNADFRDFNPTEWLNLELTTECYQIEYEMMESYRRTALQEALIFTDDEPLKFSRIKAMQEAEGGKLKDAITTIINRIREFIEQFFAKIKDKFGANSRYISSNKETIAKPINSSMECKSKGDILAGLYRVQERTALKPFNYETMKEDLKDKNTFFKNHVLSTLSGTSPNSKRQVKYEDGMAITEYCKAYFGAPMPEDKYPLCTFTAKDLESNKENMVKFVQDSAKFLASIKTDLRNLEAEAKKNAVNEPIKNDGTADKKTNSGETQSSTTPALGSGETKQESTLYSYLYNSWFTEAEINVDEEKTKESGEGSGANDRATAFKNYVECYKDVILSKLTAAEFISSEFMQIIEKHVEMNGGSKQKTQKDNDQK